MQNRREHLRKGTQSNKEALVRDVCTHGTGIYTDEMYQKEIRS